MVTLAVYVALLGYNACEKMHYGLFMYHHTELIRRHKSYFFALFSGLEIRIEARFFSTVAGPIPFTSLN